MKSRHHVALSLLTLCISQQLYAQTNANSVQSASGVQATAAATSNASSSDVPSVTLDAITVSANAKTGTALAQKISEMPAVTQVIREADIQAQATGNRTVGDILAQLVPSLGVSSGSVSNYGTTMHGRPVQYLLNGVPLTGSRSLSRELNSIDPEQIERVEVLSGATSIYGAGAAGGLINIVTKSTAGYGFTGQTRLGINSSREFKSDSLGYHVGHSFGYGGERVYGNVDIDYEATGGKFDSHGDRISPDANQTDNQDTDTVSVNANLGFDISDTKTMNLAATYYDSEQDTDYGVDYGDNLSVLLKGTTPSLRAIDGADIENQPYNTKSSVNLNYNDSDFLGSNLSLTGYYRDEKARFYPSGKSFTSQAKDVWVNNGLTDADTLGKLLGASVVVTQSEADIEVIGLRAAMQTETDVMGKNTLFSYGVDFEREESEQTYYGQDLTTFLASNGLTSTSNGLSYNGGPKTTIDKWGAFVNADVDMTDKWHTSAGVRYQNIKSDTDRFVPIYEQLLADYFATNGISDIADAYGIDYEAGAVEAGSSKHDKVLFNLGTSYQLTDDDQVFANFSQGFTTADVQRALRDVRAGFVVNSDNIQPISINNYELGWTGKRGDTSAKVSGFYNDSDKTVRFTNDYTVEVVDTDERIYGAEASLTHDLNKDWQFGGSLAYTRGQYKKDGDWLELDAVRLTPLKGTAYAQYNFSEGSNIRLQALAVGGSDKAYKDQQNDPDASAQPLTGYATFDVLGQVKLPVGRMGYGVYNILNKDYQTVYHQTTFGDLNRLPASGTTYGLSYTVDY
ncbi:TonB-dependent receptor [Psychrobacter sp. UBA2514]|jgi:iron complex outermembrane receptor protein|uniref:TonB-dependent receptor n=1 Tax=Psychrobacter sp. UBA2514 TaxID=1947346 RepID=UPI00258028AE|nr:TonB-dependent receptor [Psychrobacter sp. UBA2514]|tara:strand:- start:3239 stop:5623 length:2385 start_codon:yes stop_codon:yes gene_type:complete